MALMTPYVFRGNCTVEDVIDGDTVIVSGPCIMSGRSVRVSVPKEALAKYQLGGYVQDCFPMLSASDREFLMSGISSAAWDEMFPKEDEDA